VSSKAAPVSSTFNVEEIRAQFPILKELVHGKPLVYFDNAATSQKPRRVIKAESAYYATINANVHRGVHTLSTKATEAQEAARETIRKHINAKHAHEVIFTSGTTASMNLAAFSLGQLLLKKGDEVLISGMEHHANIVPWQLACERHGAKLKVIPITDNGEWDVTHVQFSDKTRILSISQVSNTLGTINPVKELIAEARKRGIITVVDGAQAIAHLNVDVQDLGCDLYAFSGHKAYGPTGTGVLYGREELLERMPPWQGGGEMIDTVTFAKTTYAKLPFKFEAGTPHIAGIIGLGEAIRWMEDYDKAAMAAHEHRLLEHATKELLTISGLRIIGAAKEKVGVVSFVIDPSSASGSGVHHYDLGTLLDQQGIAVRTGHHCTQPLMERFGVSGTTRASFACFNTVEEVEVMVAATRKAVKMLR
jgi:cysteine desulfurase/selenocysteine lyase